MPFKHFNLKDFQLDVKSALCSTIYIALQTMAMTIRVLPFPRPFSGRRSRLVDTNSFGQMFLRPKVCWMRGCGQLVTPNNASDIVADVLVHQKLFR